ncbi:MAG: class I SAM-dependent methyltransferase [Candidatus Edwardsbacteria bacterium]
MGDLYGIIPVSYSLWLRRKVLDCIEQIFKKHIAYKAIRLLDAGCGNGEFSLVFSRMPKVCSIVGVDFAKEMLSVAQKRASLNGYADRFEAVEANLEDLSVIADCSFELIWFFGVIEHLAQPRKVIEQLKKKLKPGGTFILKVPRRWSIAYWVYLMFGQSPKNWGKPKRLLEWFDFQNRLKYYRWYSVSEVVELCQASGLIILEQVPVNYSQVNVGPISYLFRLLGRIGAIGFRVLDLIDLCFKLFYRIPSTEFLVLTKDG